MRLIISALREADARQLLGFFEGLVSVVVEKIGLGDCSVEP
jgi:hypothetical protein